MISGNDLGFITVGEGSTRLGRRESESLLEHGLFSSQIQVFISHIFYFIFTCKFLKIQQK